MYLPSCHPALWSSVQRLSLFGVEGVEIYLAWKSSRFVPREDISIDVCVVFSSCGLLVLGLGCEVSHSNYYTNIIKGLYKLLCACFISF